MIKEKNMLTRLLKSIRICSHKMRDQNANRQSCEEREGGGANKVARGECCLTINF